MTCRRLLQQTLKGGPKITYHLYSLARPDVPGKGTSGHYCQHSVIQWNFIRVTSRRSVTSKKCNRAIAQCAHTYKAIDDNHQRRRCHEAWHASNHCIAQRPHQRKWITLLPVTNALPQSLRSCQKFQLPFLCYLHSLICALALPITTMVTPLLRVMINLRFRRHPRNAGNSDQTFPSPKPSGHARLPLVLDKGKWSK